MADEYEVVGQEVEFDWGDAPLIKPRAGGLGDRFPVVDEDGKKLRYTMETMGLALSQSKTGKRRIDLEALCVSGDSAGLTLKQSFYLATKEAIQADSKKAFGASQFQNYTVACGDPPRSAREKVNLGRYLGARFEFMPRDKTIEGNEKMMPDGTMKTYKATTTTEVDKFFRVNAARPVGAEPLELDDSDFNPRSRSADGPLEAPRIAGAIAGRRAA